ncbi:MAG TPA: hypothetical protein VLW85_12635, partial [Myxococcales bacterium]|nr:hypothetical protein [Myxococcales bacterium]
ARDSYRRALELDPTLDYAHAGLAALRCAAGDLQGGRDELARVHDKSAASVDGAQQKCGGAQ